MVKQIVVAGAAAVLVLSACEGPAGPAGATGAQGPGFTAGASVSAVYPNHVFIGRAQELTLSGFATEWTDGTTVDFGADVTVESVHAASATALVVKVAVAGTAAAGARDVKVTTGGNTLTFSNGFHLDSPLSLSVNTLPQGGLMPITVENLDMVNPFDGNAPFEATLQDGILTSSAPSLFSANAMLGVDILASPGLKDLSVTSGDTTYAAPGAVMVTPRAPMALTAGTPATGNVATNFQTAVYAYTATAAGTVVASLSSNDSLTSTLMVVPPSGKLGDVIAYGEIVSFDVTAGATWFLIVFDRQGEAFSYSLEVRPVNLVAEAASNETVAAAQALTPLPALVQNAVLTDYADQDWFKVSVTAADVGKSLHLMTIAGDAATDTVITVYDPGGTPIEQSEDSNYHESLVVPALGFVGDYHIAITASPQGTIPEGQYNLLVVLK